MIMQRALPAMVFGLSLLTSLDAGAGGMTIASPDIQPGATINEEQVLQGFGCTGQNLSPALSWSGTPAGAKSLALTVFDSDAPGGGWWHWIIFDMPPSTTGLPKNAGSLASNLAPSGSVQSRNSFGTPGWGGPCPPQGDPPHHYIFTIYALGIDRLGVNADVSPAAIGSSLQSHTLDKASLTGLYGRK
jgi:Raf kinase inhibitor-like YbhB/YbcL family protein